MNFGTLKDIFLENLIESYSSENDKGKELYKKFLNLIKENEVLKTAFIVFKNIETKTIVSEASAINYLNECKNLFDLFRGDKSLPKNLEKLTTLLEEYEIDYSNKKDKPLHESLQNYILTSKNINTLDELHESQSNVVSHLLTEKNSVNTETNEYVKEGVDPKKFLEIAVNKFNEKYKDSLTEEEKNILKVLGERNEQKTKTLVQQLVKENISLVNQCLSENSDNITIKSKLLETKDAIYKIMEDNGSFEKNILKLYELKKNLKND